MHSDGQMADFNSRKIDALAKSLDMAEAAYYHETLKERQMSPDDYANYSKELQSSDDK